MVLSIIAYSLLASLSARQVDLYLVIEPPGQIEPWRSGTIAVRHRLYEPPVIHRGCPDRAFAPKQPDP
jgi:hypothetical protein